MYQYVADVGIYGQYDTHTRTQMHNTTFHWQVVAAHCIAMHSSLTHGINYSTGIFCK